MNGQRIRHLTESLEGCGAARDHAELTAGNRNSQAWNLTPDCRVQAPDLYWRQVQAVGPMEGVSSGDDLLPGTLCSQSGIYQVSHRGHRVVHKVLVRAGDRFPPCSGCGENLFASDSSSRSVSQRPCAQNVRARKAQGEASQPHRAYPRLRWMIGCSITKWLL